MPCCVKSRKRDRAIRGGQWQTTLGHGARGKFLGLVGLGRLGEEVAKIGKAFGMSILAWSSNLSAERAEQCGAELVTKDELFSRSDVISIHLKLSERSRGIVGLRELNLMKPSAYLINTSRGPIVEEQALIDALRRGTIAGAGLDVYDQEPLPRDHPFLRCRTLVYNSAYRVRHRGELSDFLQPRCRRYRRVSQGRADSRHQWRTPQLKQPQLTPS